MNPIALNLMIPFLGALGCLFFFQKEKYQKIWSFLSLSAGLGASVFLFLKINEVSVISHVAGGWPAPFGIALAVDRLSAPILVLTQLLALLTFIYRQGFSNPDSRENSYYLPLFHFLIAGVTGALSTGDFFNLYVFFEVFLMASFALLAQKQNIEATMGTTKYVVLNLLGSLIFLSGLGLLYSQTGTLNMAAASKSILDMGFAFTQPKETLYLGLPFIFFAIAFGMKAAVFPLYSWLPASYPLADTATTALLAGTLTKVGVYSLLRTQHLGLFYFVPNSANLFLFVGSLTMLVGVFGAATQNQISRILSVHIVSQVGYMIACIGTLSGKALSAALLFMAHNMLVKTNLFYVDGFIQKTQGSGELSKLGSGLKNRPLVSIIFIVSALSLVGVPPLSGFWGKFQIFSALIEKKNYLTMVAGLITGVFTLYSMLKIWNEAFLKPANETKQILLSRADNLSMQFSMIFLLTLIVLSAFFIEPITKNLGDLSQYLSSPKAYVESQLGPISGFLEAR